MDKAFEVVRLIQEAHNDLLLLVDDRYDEVVAPYHQLLKGLMKQKGWHVAEALYDALKVLDEAVTEEDQSVAKLALSAAAYDISVSELSQEEGPRE